MRRHCHVRSWPNDGALSKNFFDIKPLLQITEKTSAVRLKYLGLDWRSPFLLYSAQLPAGGGPPYMSCKCHASTELGISPRVLAMV